MAFENTVNGGIQIIPLGWSGGEIRFQQMYTAAEVGISSISQVCFRSNAPSSAGTNNIVVKMGYSSLMGLTENFDNNFSSAPTTVFSGELCFPEVTQNDANNFLACINFTTPFAVTTDNIVLEIQSDAFMGGPGGHRFDPCQDCFALSPSRLFDLGDKNAATGTTDDDVLITRFSTATSPTTDFYPDFDDDGYPDGPPLMCTSDPGSNYKKVGELESTDLDCDSEDPNLTFPGNSCVSGLDFAIDDFVTEDCECVPGAFIPTLTQWGIIALLMIMLIIGLVVVRQRQSVLKS